MLTYNIFIHKEVLIWIKIYRNTLVEKEKKKEQIRNKISLLMSQKASNI